MPAKDVLKKKITWQYLLLIHHHIRTGLH